MVQVDGNNSESIGSLEAALDLLRRLPPQNIESNLISVTSIIPQHSAELFNIVDVPSKVRTCAQTGQEYLCCDYNRDGDSYRSPWSGEYDPPSHSEGGGEETLLKPSERLRKMEIIANDAFGTYKSLYFEGGLSSVYVWDMPSVTDNLAFAAAVLIRKDADTAEGLRSGCWDAIHVIEVDSVATSDDSSQQQAQYKLTSTVILHLDAAIPNVDNFILSGSITRQQTQTITLKSNDSNRDEEHVANMGRLVEDMETRMRNNLQDIYFGKSLDVVNEIRPVMPAGFMRHQADLHREMAAKLAITNTKQRTMDE